MLTFSSKEVRFSRWAWDIGRQDLPNVGRPVDFEPDLDARVYFGCLLKIWIFSTKWTRGTGRSRRELFGKFSYFLTYPVFSLFVFPTRCRVQNVSPFLSKIPNKIPSSGLKTKLKHSSMQSRTDPSKWPLSSTLGRGHTYVLQFPLSWLVTQRRAGDFGIAFHWSRVVPYPLGQRLF